VEIGRTYVINNRDTRKYVEVVLLEVVQPASSWDDLIVVEWPDGTESKADANDLDLEPEPDFELWRGRDGDGPFWG
jgi:hypothetical protein